jgi:regulator of cell morphogenesis and NO signaling
VETKDILNVGVIEPGLKHLAIFQKYDSILPGSSFIVHDDHDPKSLYDQLIAERGEVFTWEYLERGPEVWKVKIAKKGEDIQEETIGEMVTNDFRKAQVFKKLGIDFCCGGKKTLSEISAKKGISLEKIKEELKAVDNLDSVSCGLSFNKWEIDFLSDYVINTHHQYCRESIPFSAELAHKVARVHGEGHPEVVKVAEIFDRIAQDLTLHMMKEEKIVFPYIKELVNAKKTDGILKAKSFGNISSPIQVMDMEHEEVGENFERIRELTSGYTPPPDACNSYIILYKKLEEFENDLHKHVHLESNIIFPKAIKLEKELNGAV